MVSGWQREAVNRLLVTIVRNDPLVPEDLTDFVKTICVKPASYPHGLTEQRSNVARRYSRTTGPFAWPP